MKFSCCFPDKSGSSSKKSAKELNATVDEAGTISSLWLSFLFLFFSLPFDTLETMQGRTENYFFHHTEILLLHRGKMYDGEFGDYKNLFFKIRTLSILCGQLLCICTLAEFCRLVMRLYATRSRAGFHNLEIRIISLGFLSFFSWHYLAWNAYNSMMISSLFCQIFHNFIDLGFHSFEILGFCR